MENSTFGQKEAFTLIASGAQGLVLLLCNLLLVLTISYHSALRCRKEFVILGAIAGVDCIFGTSLLWGSISKAHQYLTGWAETPFHRWQCILKGHSILYFFAVAMQGQFLVIRSVDRLLAVSVPFGYLKLQPSYAYCVSLIPLVSVPSVSVWFVISAWPDTKALNDFYCTPRTTLLEHHRTIWVSLHALFGLISVLIYIPVYIIYKRALTVSPGNQVTVIGTEQKRQRKVTESMGLGCLGTFLLFILPAFVTLTPIGKVIDLGNYLFLFYNCNALTNLTIFAKRHVEMRLGLVKLFKRQELPPNLDVVRQNIQNVKNRNQANRTNRVKPLDRI